MNALELRRRTLGKGVYKKTVEGNPAIAQGSLARRYPGITMQGWTEQAQYEGNQLFDASVFDGIEWSGVRVSVDNGVITASGMSETAIWIKSTKFSEEDFKKLKSGNIYVKNYKTADCNYEVSIYINNTTVKEGNSPHTIPDGYLETKPNNVYFFIDIRAGIELKGSCKPMIYQDGDGTWESYTGGQPSPNPDYPQPITSAGKYDEGTQKWEYEVEVSCGQLFDYQNLTKVQDGNGRMCNGAAFTGLPAGKYTIYATDKTDNRADFLYGKVINKSGTYGNAMYVVANGVFADYTFDISDGDTFIFYDAIGHTIEQSKALFAKYKIMFCAGETKLPYSPYRTPQTVTIQSDRPLTKWDRLIKKDGVWGWGYKSEEIESYTDESVPGEYFSTTGQLSTGAQVWYETTTETFIPLTASEQEAMNALYTFRPTTVLSNDCDCNMSLTYKTKKSLEATT